MNKLLLSLSLVCIASACAGGTDKDGESDDDDGWSGGGDDTSVDDDTGGGGGDTLALVGSWTGAEGYVIIDIDETHVEKTWTTGAPADGYAVVAWDNALGHLDVLGDPDSWDADQYLRFFWTEAEGDFYWCESKAFSSQEALADAKQPDASDPTTKGCTPFGGPWWKLVAR